MIQKSTLCRSLWHYLAHSSPTYSCTVSAAKWQSLNFNLTKKSWISSSSFIRYLLKELIQTCHQNLQNEALAKYFHCDLVRTTSLKYSYSDHLKTSINLSKNARLPQENWTKQSERMETVQMWGKRLWLVPHGNATSRWSMRRHSMRMKSSRLIKIFRTSRRLPKRTIWGSHSFLSRVRIASQIPSKKSSSSN